MTKNPCTPSTQNILFLGGLGELGSSLIPVLEIQGMNVVVATRRPQEGDSNVIYFDEAIELTELKWPDLIIISTSVGNNRNFNFFDPNLLEPLIVAANSSGIRIIHISSTRVLEGHSGNLTESSVAFPLTKYAERNSAYEDFLLKSCGPNLTIIRVSNYFAPPTEFNSPQSLSVPWSMLKQALYSGEIRVRNSEKDYLEFVSSDDLASAIAEVVLNPPSSRICVTFPGFIVSFGQMAELLRITTNQLNSTRPTIHYSGKPRKSLDLSASWLAEIGWKTSLNREEMLSVMTEWGSRHLDKILADSNSVNK